MLKKGDKAPEFSLQNDKGEVVSLESLKGKKVVLYFYPKDDTPGCTIEANDFSSLEKRFAKLNVIIMGVSPDNIDSHKSFKAKYDLKIDLLVDNGNDIAKQYFAYGEKNLYGKKVLGIIRSTFIIDDKGVIEEAFYNIKAKGHADRIIEIVEKS